ncbi:ribokinase [Peribacillus cavernae]|uniref:Ribokinase n=1 Tax=Peribacillus cavernae TaxID=1674310 RepID=A0A3S0WCZ2_9BACI|nr:ribokinase [Peribacillus cavernae]MDQ0218092.1 ribokinase [Peribacillus cavernae]RUQ32750.1 ribokinase [Peribacillus cavernae]
MPKIVVIGSYVVDLMSRAPHLPKPGETVLGGPFKMGPGGKGGNQATAAVRCGSNVTFVTRLGDDVFGREALEHFRRERVNTQYIKHDKDEATGAALISVDQQSENSIVVALGACGKISEGDVLEAEAEIKEADIVLLQLETSIEAVVASVRLSAKHGVPVILNPAPFQKFSKEILKDVSYITPNETEAHELTGVEVIDEHSALIAAKKLYELGVKNVIITLGKQGAFLYTGGEKGKLIPGFTVDAIDTTGAGDAFNGGFAHAVASGKSITDAMIFGNCVAALSVTKIGTAPAMPIKTEIDEFLKHNGVLI